MAGSKLLDGPGNRHRRRDREDDEQSQQSPPAGYYP
jgi:hypothetical protein